MALSGAFGPRPTWHVGCRGQYGRVLAAQRSLSGAMLVRCSEWR